ncbi:MAG: MerR family transcriptional regulator [Trebonia sp.]
MKGPGDRPVYSISAVARMLNVPVATLRTWEDRYGQVIPARNEGGRRLYTRQQVEQLRFIRARMSEGVGAADAHRLLAERTESGQPLSGPAEPGPRLLIQLAESDAYAAEFEEYFLTTEGFEVQVTLTDAAAREAFAAARPVVAIIEVLISGGAGLDLCRYLREQNEATAIVVVSAVEAMDAAIDAGADAFLRKPLNPLQLVSTVRDLLGSSALLTR